MSMTRPVSRVAPARCAVDQSIARVRAFARARRLSPGRLARDAGLHPNTLRGLDRPDWNPRAGTLRRLEGMIAEARRTGRMMRAHRGARNSQPPKISLVA